MLWLSVWTHCSDMLTACVDIVLIWSIFDMLLWEWEPHCVVSGLVLTHYWPVVPTRHANPGLTLPVGRNLPASHWSSRPGPASDWLMVPGLSATTLLPPSVWSRPGQGNLWYSGRKPDMRCEGVMLSDKCQCPSSLITNLSHRPGQHNCLERVILKYEAINHHCWKAVCIVQWWALLGSYRYLYLTEFSWFSFFNTSYYI